LLLAGVFLFKELKQSPRTFKLKAEKTQLIPIKKGLSAL
jgi:hypothetical protein